MRYAREGNQYTSLIKSLITAHQPIQPSHCLARILAAVNHYYSNSFESHSARDDAHCVMHTHTLPGMAVAACEEGLLQLNQISTEFYQRVGYHPYEGASFDLDERARIQRSLGENIALILQSHGLLSVGRTIADAFYIMYYLNRACEIQLAAAQLSPLGTIRTIPEPLSHHACQQLMGVEQERQLVWQAWLRRLDRIDDSYKK